MQVAEIWDLTISPVKKRVELFSTWHEGIIKIA
jgi:hypothetical protein